MLIIFVLQAIRACESEIEEDNTCLAGSRDLILQAIRACESEIEEDNTCLAGCQKPV